MIANWLLAGYRLLNSTTSCWIPITDYQLLSVIPLFPIVACGMVIKVLQISPL
jgi:hypothetical protein